MKLGSVLMGLGASAFTAACCGIGAGGARVIFTGQTNVVVWDAARGIEHFVRDASFATKGKDLGFIAPTPSQPTLSEVDPEVFSTLAALEPHEEMAGDAVATASLSMAGGVELVAEQDVAGYHASILRATDPKALTDWLSKNGYPSPAFLKPWVAPYIQKGWYLTAFKVRGGQTGPVRMSFATKTPFNPYSVPEENGNGGTIPLRLFYISAGGEEPRIGGKDAWREAQWTATLDESNSATVAQQLRLKPDAMPSNARVAAYQDNQFGVPELDDLYFVPTGNRFAVPVGIGIATITLFLLWRLRGITNPVPVRP